MRKGFKFSLVETRIGLLYGVKQELSCGDHAGPHVCVCVCLCVCVWGGGGGVLVHQYQRLNCLTDFHET